MDKEARSAIERATQRARRLLEDDYREQLEGHFAIPWSGPIAPVAGKHLPVRDVPRRRAIVSAIAHRRAAGKAEEEAVAAYVRDAAFTTLNRLAALKMLERRELTQECIGRGEQSAGYKELLGMAPGVATLPNGAGYRLYLESLYDELSTEVKVLFDRRDPASVLWPGHTTLAGVLALLDAPELEAAWGEDETIGWVYQYFNAPAERQAMRDVTSGGSQAPRDPEELATRNQFFTPRYIVRFLTDNTLGRLWWEMRGGKTALVDRCALLVIRPGEAPPARPRKDPRDLKVLDPACGSGHFLLYAFDLLTTIYEEAWADPESPPWTETGRRLGEDYADVEALRRAAPELILRHNLFGVDIDPRCAQIAQLALWMRAQRAFREAGLRRGERPRIRRSNVVVAEPIPASAELRRAFVATLEDRALAARFEALVDAMSLAGDLGLLLKVEDVLGGRTADGQSGDLFAARGSQLRDAVAAFAREAAATERTTRRMFADDALAGLGLVEMAERRFDVVVMNPPFGEPTARSKEVIEETYPDSRGDLSTVFVERCIRDLAPHGLVGVIAAEAGLYRRTLEAWRRKVLLGASRLEVLAHLGGHVLDGAIVRTAAYVTAPRATPRPATFLRVLGAPKDARDVAVEAAVRGLRSGTVPADVFVTDQREFDKLPYAVFGYWCSPELRDVFVASPKLERNAGRARVGLQTSDDFRFLRLRWEVEPGRVGDDAWMLFAKGGEYSPFSDDIHLVIQWTGLGEEVIAWGKSKPQNVEMFGRPGVTYPLRTAKRLSPRVLPEGCAFGHKGPSIVDCPSPWGLLALLNSCVVAYFLGLALGMSESEGGAGANSYEVGLIQRLPVPRDLATDGELPALAKAAWSIRAEEGLRDETTTLFASPAAPVALQQSLAATWSALVARDQQRLAAYVAAQEAIDRRTVALYGLTAADWQEIEASVGDVHRPEVDTSDRARAAWVETVVSFLVGCAFGRWDPARLTRAASVDPAHAFDAPVAHTAEVPSAPPILVDDPGHPLDLARRCAAALEAVAPDRAEDLAAEAAALLGVGDVRAYLRRAFFATHVRAYSKSRRTAPIFLPLGTASGSFQVWLDLHRVGRDTLFTVQNELVADKLRLEEGRAAARRAGSEPASRKEMAEQEALVDELRAMADEVRRVAPLWAPDLDDGVVVTFAPLWRLFPHHKAWQKTLQETWHELAAGDLDWAHLAMHLWPERVVPRCRTDRSLAIAHGLEEVFWLEGDDGKWKPRPTPTRPIAELVAERQSPAVQAALRSLIEASSVGAAKKGRKARA